MTIITAQIPTDRESIENGITALEWQLQQNIDGKSRQIFQKTLQQYKDALKSLDKN